MFTVVRDVTFVLSFFSTSRFLQKFVDMNLISNDKFPLFCLLCFCFMYLITSLTVIPWSPLWPGRDYTHLCQTWIIFKCSTILKKNSTLLQLYYFCSSGSRWVVKPKTPPRTSLGQIPPGKDVRRPPELITPALVDALNPIRSGSLLDFAENTRLFLFLRDTRSHREESPLIFKIKRPVQTTVCKKSQKGI